MSLINEVVIRKVSFKLNDYLRRAYLYHNRKFLHNQKPSIIASNCWGGIVYQDLGLPYLSPFVNMYIFPECFLRMLGKLDYYLDHPLQFVTTSRYADANLKRSNHKYPIGILDDVEIHFIHYTSEEDTLLKWKQRVLRFNRQNPIIIMSERDGCTKDHIAAFDELPYRLKACFTHRRYSLASSVWLPGVARFGQLPGADEISGISYWRLPLIPFLNKQPC